MKWPFARGSTVRTLEIALSAERSDYGRLYQLYAERNQEVYRLQQRVNDRYRKDSELQEARQAAKSAREGHQIAEARATQLEAQNAALRAALLALGGAVIEVSQ